MTTIDKRHWHEMTEEEQELQEDKAICGAVQTAIMSGIVSCSNPRKPGVVVGKLPKQIRELLKKSTAKHYQMSPNWMY